MARCQRMHGMALAVLCGSLSIAAPARALTGDINDDLKVTAADAILALRAAGGFVAPPSRNVQNGDVAGGPNNKPDGRLSLPDAVRILRHVTGLDPFPSPIVSARLSGSLTISGDVTKDWSLPRAYWVRGTVTGPAPSGQSDPTSTMRFIPRGDVPAQSSGWATSGNFVIPVRSGVNDAFLDLEYLEYDAEGTAVDYTARLPLQPASLNVTNETTQNFTYAAIPVPGRVSGTINAPGWEIASLGLALPNGSRATADIDDEVSPVAYTMVSAPGTGFMNVDYGIAGPNAETDLIAILKNSTVTVTPGGEATADITLPALKNVSGTITASADEIVVGTVSTMGGGSWVQAFAMVSGNGNYILYSPTGTVRRYVTLFTYSADGWTGRSHIQPVTLPSAGGTLDITPPAQPPLRTVSGIIRDAAGNPAKNVGIEFNPAGEPVDLPDGWYGAAYAVTDADGLYSTQLIAGSYRVDIVPQEPEGPPAGTAASTGKRRLHWLKPPGR